MKCPNCSEKMDQGYLQGMRRVAWVKNKHKFSLLPKQAEVLLENNTVKDFLLKAWICKNCKKIIIDYSNKEVREG